MATGITTVVFDLGGVLIDWNPRHLYRKVFGADVAAMEAFLAEICTPEWNAALDAGGSFAGAVAQLAAAHPEQAELIDMYHSRWPEMLGDSFAGTVEILGEVRRAGYRTYALSNWSAETFPMTRPLYPFLGEMDGILISGEVGVGKPDPAIFREFIARFGIEPSETVYIDDWDRNVAAANGLGLCAIQFIDADQLRADLRRLGVAVAAAPPAPHPADEGAGSNHSGART
jgi:2-haloacid dehalogenase